MSSSPAILRPFVLSDLSDFFVWASDELVAASCTWSPYKTKEDLLLYMEQNVLNHPFFRAIIACGRPVGAVSVNFFDESVGARRRGEIGYVLARDWWGKGVMTRAVRAATEAAMAENGELERVEAAVETGNLASQRVLEKVGFVREGVMRKYSWSKGVIRDMVMFSFVRGDRFLV